MKVGLLGAGRIGALHAGVLAGDPGVEEILVGDADSLRAEGVAAEVGGEARGIEEVLASGPDAVVIAASTPAHAPLILASVEAGIPAFCEKPIALGYDDTVEVVEAVESSGAVLQIGFQRRFDAGYAEARHLVETGALGTIYSIRLATHDPEPPPEEYIAASGGIFRDLHIHDFDILRWLSGGEVAEVYAAGGVRGFDFFARHGDVDTSAALITMQDGAVAVLTGGRHDPPRLRRARRGLRLQRQRRRRRGRTHAPALRRAGHTTPEKTAYPNFQERFLDAYRAEMKHFLSLARGEAENRGTARDALEALRIAMAADLSLAEHRSVAIAEVG